MMQRVLIALACCVALLCAGELWLHASLFRHVSYSNSESIDAQLRQRDAGGPWKMLFVGDSEVHWGIDPSQIDAGYADRGQTMLSFNHGFDGFGASWWVTLLPHVLQAPSLKSVETVVVGVQLTDELRAMRETGEDCGALQRPVLTSSFAVDLGLDGMCDTRTWDARLGRDLFGMLWTVRYAPAVRTLVLPDAIFKFNQLRFNSRKAGDPHRGFEAHRTIAEDESIFESEFGRWKAQYQPERDFQPLPPQAWPAMVATGGFFDQLQRAVAASGRQLALYALPTNPLLIDTFHRRGDYARNSVLLAQWAARHGVVYVDLGLQERSDAAQYFSDMRHLSGVGARDYSRRLGRALAQAQQAHGAVTPIARPGQEGEGK